jgi:intracellular sulfur oxidation DsrE/DsrF family protein
VKALLAVLALCCGVLPATASADGQSTASVSAPFATQRLLLQLSDASMDKQKLIISVANSILKDFGPDNVSIDVVAFGPGVQILYANSPERVAVDSLVAQGVHFDVCMNTINTITRDTGHTPALNPNAVPVPYGVGRIMALVEQGYILVRP